MLTRAEAHHAAGCHLARPDPERVLEWQVRVVLRSQSGLRISGAEMTVQSAELELRLCADDKPAALRITDDLQCKRLAATGTRVQTQACTQVLRGADQSAIGARRHHLEKSLSRQARRPAIPSKSQARHQRRSRLRAAVQCGINSLPSELPRTPACERGEVGNYELEIAAATASPSPTADHFAESNDGTRVQAEHSAQLKHASTQPPQVTAGR
jgi:hypothetical protein